MSAGESCLLELTAHEVFTLRDALLYYAEWSSDELHANKSRRAADLRLKLLQCLTTDSNAASLHAVAGG